MAENATPAEQYRGTPVAAPSVALQLVPAASDEYRAIFNTLVQTDCSKHVEKKGGMSYLSWAFAVDMLLRVAPDAKFKVCEFGGEIVRDLVTGAIVIDDFGDPKVHNGEPFQKTSVGYFVKAKVRIKDVIREMRLPVLNSKNMPIADPSSFDINTSGMRVLTKCIAMHGLGLFLYQGEDLPLDEASVPTTAAGKKVKTEAQKESPATQQSAKATTVNVLETQCRRVALANSNALLGYHKHAATHFSGDDLVKVRAAISKRAAELKIELPKLEQPVAEAA